MSNLNKTDATLMVGFSRITNYLHHEISILCNKYDLTQTQFAILDVLNTKGELLVGEIQTLILSTPGNVPYVINNLINKGFVTKTNLNSDKRCSKVSLTPLGKSKIADILPAHDELLTAKFAVLSDSEKEGLLSLVSEFQTKLNVKEKLWTADEAYLSSED